VRTSITRIGAGRRVGLKNSLDCDDRILERRNGDNSAAGAARTYRSLMATATPSGNCSAARLFTRDPLSSVF